MRILVLDDDRALRSELSSFLTLNGHEALLAADLAEATSILAAGGGAGPVDLVLADLFLGKDRGTDLLPDCTQVPVVVISGAGGVREAVAALKAGAWDFLEKPVDPDRLLGLLRNLDRGLQAERGLSALRQDWLAEHAAFAPGSPFALALAEAGKVASSPLSVLVTGPSGSGKEIIAKWIHYCSARSGGPFVAVNCAAVPPELAEAAFFGARRGAYTGADADRQGWFQAANGGTLFLDEVGDVAPSVQAKLLRAVECGEVQRLGSTQTERISLRLVSATNRDLSADCALGRFREDLYWRLAQATISVPALSQRKADIAALARFFLARAGGSASGSASGSARGSAKGDVSGSASGGARGEVSAAAASLDDDAIAWLEARAWPGNVRELRAFVERALWLSPGPRIGVADLEALDQRPPAANGASRQEMVRALPLVHLAEAKLSFEKAYVGRALDECDGSVARAALKLGILPNNLSRKIRELGIKGSREP